MQKIFFDNYALLGGIFEKFSTLDSNINLKMTKRELLNLLLEADIIKPMPEVPVAKKDDKILVN